MQALELDLFDFHEMVAERMSVKDKEALASADPAARQRRAEKAVKDLYKDAALNVVRPLIDAIDFHLDHRCRSLGEPQHIYVGKGKHTPNITRVHMDFRKDDRNPFTRISVQFAPLDEARDKTSLVTAGEITPVSIALSKEHVHEVYDSMVNDYTYENVVGPTDLEGGRVPRTVYQKLAELFS